MVHTSEVREINLPMINTTKASDKQPHPKLPMIKNTKINDKHTVAGIHDGDKDALKSSHGTVQIRKTIYSAAAIDPTF